MHEWKITEAVIEEVFLHARENKLKKINRVCLSIGDDVLLTSDTIRLCFQTLSKGTILENVCLDINKRFGKGITLESLEGER